MRKNGESVPEYEGDDRLLLGLFLAVITFGLFAQTMLNTGTTIRLDLGIDVNASNIAVSITSLFSGIFVVLIGSLGDRFGRMKIIRIGLVLSIIGSFLIGISPKGTASFLLIGRIIQGLSAASILPNALAVIKAYYRGASRQRAISVYSIATWGGAGFSSIFGGIIASTLGWRWNYWLSIVVAILSFYLIAGVPESDTTSSDKGQDFDLAGLITFIIATISINIVISQGSSLGWFSPITLGLVALTVVLYFIFYKIEKGKENSFIDFNMFKDKTFTGATISNFLMNGIAGALIVSLSLLQLGAELTSFQAGVVTIGYPIAILIAIKAGEKLLQKWGARKPMIWGCIFAGIGILMLSVTTIMTSQYLILAAIGFIFYGMGLGLYATPSADAALSSVPMEKAGSASGIYRMSASLGAGFGIAISAALFSGLSMGQVTFVEGLFRGRADNISIRYAASIALLYNFVVTLISIISILLTIPANKAKKS